MRGMRSGILSAGGVTVLGCVSLSSWDLVDLGAEFVSGEYTAAWRSEPELLVALRAARRERRVD